MTLKTWWQKLKFWQKSVLLGFIIAIFPIIINLIQVLTTLGYWDGFILLALKRLIISGLIGIILSALYISVHKQSRKSAKIFAIVVIIIYYSLTFFIIGIIEYFRIVGPPI